MRNNKLAKVAILADPTMGKTHFSKHHPLKEYVKDIDVIGTIYKNVEDWREIKDKRQKFYKADASPYMCEIYKAFCNGKIVFMNRYEYAIKSLFFVFGKNLNLYYFMWDDNVSDKFLRKRMVKRGNDEKTIKDFLMYMSESRKSVIAINDYLKSVPGLKECSIKIHKVSEQAPELFERTVEEIVREYIKIKIG
jgi:hypothetical protein